MNTGTKALLVVAFLFLCFLVWGCMKNGREAPLDPESPPVGSPSSRVSSASKPELICSSSKESVNSKMHASNEHDLWKRQQKNLYERITIKENFTNSWLTAQLLPNQSQNAVQSLVIGTRSHLLIVQVHYDEDHIDTGNSGKVQIVQQIKHPGEVKRARYMPQNPFIIATKTVNAEVYLVNCTEPPLEDACNPDLRLKGKTKNFHKNKNSEYGLSWNSFKMGQLLSGFGGDQIYLLDIAANGDATPDACQKFKCHDVIVEDVDWLSTHTFGSVGDDHCLHIWDVRSPHTTKPVQSLVAHKGEVNCLAFNTLNQRYVATGSNDKTLKIFDLRNGNSLVHIFDCHSEEVIEVGWSPKNQNILASCCLGGSLMVWDQNRIGQE